MKPQPADVHTHTPNRAINSIPKIYFTKTLALQEINCHFIDKILKTNYIYQTNQYNLFYYEKA